MTLDDIRAIFLLTPLREGRRKITEAKEVGDILFLLTPLREGRQR